MTDKIIEKHQEQEHLDHIIDLVKQREYALTKSIKSAEGEARHLNSHFFDDVKLDYDGYSTAMETAISIHQQQQLLDEREHAWQHSAKQLATVTRLKDKPYFARIDFTEKKGQPETIYIGLGSFADENDHFLIYDWRAPISSIYYDGKLGDVSYQSPAGEITVNMTKKRQFVIEHGKLLDFFDTNESIGDQMLLKTLSEKSGTQMKSIVTTIQREQNKIIRNTAADLLFVQGAAGSGKTSAILQRIAYLLYRYRGNLTSRDVIMFSPNMLFNDYIKNVLPEMGEQNMVQMTYWQYVARRLPGMKVETLFEQFEAAQADSKVDQFKGSLKFFKLLTRYSERLNQQGVAFKSLYFKDLKKPFFSKEQLSEIYYSFNENYHLNNRIEATRAELLKRLNRKLSAEMRKRWVSEYIEGLSKNELTALYDKPDQEFESEAAEEKFLARKIVIKQLQPMNHRINHNQFINMRQQYLRFLRAVPQMTDLAKAGISNAAWEHECDRVKEQFAQRQLKMSDVSAYLYLYDLIAGRQMDYEMRYVFIDEIQDYTAFQLAYLKTSFPHAKFTMLGDLNQAIFTRDASRSLLRQISSLFDHEKTEVVQLTRSYRSTKELTQFTRQILRSGAKIEPFDRPGTKPALWGRTDFAAELAALEQVLQANQRQQQTTAIITKDLATAKRVAVALGDSQQHVTLIASANQRLVPGNLVIPAYLAKGLEFDAVVMWGADAQTYARPDEIQLVYTITSRAMYQLDILYTGEKSPLLPTDVSTYVEK
ncbi:MAG: AAA family ATPase [Lactobacillus sp.]|nr:AAA family ATPase [Lactobacillus sp.]MDN6043193.1 AAA family ATPase [Lactobacillus sp.]MDN6052751.1 AAA family ATPase [Lactobacillus sp.]